MKNIVYYLDKPNGTFTPVAEELAPPGPGEVLIKILRVGVCRSDVVIYDQGLPRIKTWPAIILHEASGRIDAVGEGVVKFQPGDVVGLGCDIPCPERDCVYCCNDGTGDWTSCPDTQATGHEFPGFARKYAVLPDWFVERGPIVRFDPHVSPDHACHLEPLACNLEGMLRVNNCIENRIVVIIGAGSQGTYALQSALAMNAQRVILVNRSPDRLKRVLRDFAEPRVKGLLWTENVPREILRACAPFNEPHFVMVNASTERAYRLAAQLMGYGTVMDAHAGVKDSAGKPEIMHRIDLNKDIHYRLQCYQATHGSTMTGINAAREIINNGKLPNLDRMTYESERFHHGEIHRAIMRAKDTDSLKVIIDFED
ncbi:MAG: alcohol dehydrogenase catalytic domain-containing protein [Spirochaetales bacterium]|nr:alcohol dehydrogenase catalytic domain-containing protein [Spirochaetales bacterium]